MNQDLLKDIKNTSNKLSGRLTDLSKSQNDQKQSKKCVEDIRKLQKDMEKEYQQLKPYLEKHHIDKQDFNNANNGVTRALNQPSDGNIQNALNKVSNFMTKLAA